eukprot:6440191-Amphidinium_carterae.1
MRRRSSAKPHRRPQPFAYPTGVAAYSTSFVLMRLHMCTCCTRSTAVLNLVSRICVTTRPAQETGQISCPNG